MGLFSLFRSKKKSGAEESGADASAESFARIQEFNALETDQKIELARRHLAEVSSQLEGSRLKTVDDDEIELRARMDDVPIRINLNKFGWVRLEAKVDNPVGTFILQRDHDKIPLEKEPDDDWGDDDELRIFVAKGIFVEGNETSVEQYLAALGALVPEDAAWLYGEVERLQLGFIFASADVLKVTSGRILPQLGAPVADLLAFAGVMKSMAHALARGERVAVDAAARAAPARAERVGCAYCGTRFILAVGNSHCPNCGGPYGG